MNNNIGYDILGNQFGDCVDTLIGNEVAYKPKLCNFNNISDALNMLHRHMNNKNSIAVHTDVDVDGIGSAYIIYQLLKWTGAINTTGFLINKEKVHGISQKHADYFKTHKVDLLIVLDSSCNELEVIKDMNCDVLVIDHHEMLHTETKGKTLGGQFIIVNNMIDNFDTESMKNAFNVELEQYKAEPEMSCGLLIYEILRLYQTIFDDERVLEDTYLYQWAVVTLFTDVIPLANKRNQYYVSKMFNSSNRETCLDILATTISKFQNNIDKTFINYSLAPRINKAIRAGASSRALDIVLSQPHKITELGSYNDTQDIMINKALLAINVDDSKSYIIGDISGLEINSSYCGVIAAKLCDKYRKNVVMCLRNKDGLMVGSFRGRYKGPDYRKHFEDTCKGIYAQGHAGAFGFKATMEQLELIMSTIDTIEPKGGADKFYITAGDIPESLRGTYHIDDMNQFKRERGLLNLAIANSRLSSDEGINIMVKNTYDIEVEWRGKLGTCNVLGLACKTFEQLTTEWLSIYVEYSGEVKIYIKNFKA